MKYSLPLFLLLLSISNAFSEGTKQLRPTESDDGYINLMDTQNNLGEERTFALYSSTDDTRLNVRINDPANEIVCLGFKPDSDDDLYFRIKDPNGVVVFAETLISTNDGDPGLIEDYNQAVSGPITINTGGYLPIVFTPTAGLAGDYSLEFMDPDHNPPGQYEKRHLALFDVTVVDLSLNQAIDGRLWSKAWDITTTALSKPFSAAVFIYTNDGITTQVQFDQFEAWSFIIQSNSVGPGNSGNVEIDRQSIDGGALAPDYKIFLTSPDPFSFPESAVPTIVGVPAIDLCNSSDSYCIDINVSNPGIIEYVIDIDGGIGYDHTRDLKLTTAIEGGSNCLPWDGKDGLGNALTTNDSFNVILAYQAGVTHLFLHDAENNPNGFQVAHVSPDNGLGDPLQYFDDGDPAVGGVTNLEGCSMSCHLWDSNFGNNKTINTWWVTFFENDTLRDISLTQDFIASEVRLEVNSAVNCHGEGLILDASGTTGTGDNPIYDWYLNGFLVQSGLSYSPIEMDDSDSISVVVSSEEVCIQNDTAKFIVELPVPEQSLVGIEIVEPGKCIGDEIELKVGNTLNAGSNPVYNWFVDDEFHSSSSFLIGEFSLSGQIIKLIQDPLEVCLLPDSAEFTVILAENTTPTVSISTPILSFCEVANPTFEAAIFNAGSDWSIAWFLNEQLILDASDQTLSVVLDDKDIVSAVVTGSEECTTSDVANSNKLEIEVIEGLRPEVTIQSDKTQICPNEMVQFQFISISDTGDSPIFTWFLDDIEVGKGLTYSTSEIVDSARIYAAVEVSGGCVAASKAVSNEVIVKSVLQELPILTIPLVGSFCEDQNIDISIQTTGSINSNDVKWFSDGFQVEVGPSLSTSVLNNSVRIKAEVSFQTICLDTVLQSNEVPIEKIEIPEAGIVGDLLFCEGSMASLAGIDESIDVTYSWLFNGEDVGDNKTHDFYYSGIVTQIVTRDGSCSDSVTTAVLAVEVDVYAGADRVVELGDVAWLTGTGNGGHPQWYEGDFTDQLAQTYSIEVNPNNSTVYILKDQVAGCEAVDSLVVSVYTPIRLPNAITPNNDGEHDYWVIDPDQTHQLQVRIFNRWGNLVFETYDYKNDWNGTFNGKELPVATYYYKVDGRFLGKSYTGSVSIIR